MSETLHPLTVRDFIGKYLNDETFFEKVPEFSFIRPVATKVKGQNCFCGLGEDINRATMIYNDFVKELSEDVVKKVAEAFETPKVCFSIQSQAGHSVQCY